MATRRDQALTALTGLRLTLGVGGWLAPRLTAKVFGVDPDASPAAVPLMRHFAVRDGLLGWQQLEQTGEGLDRLLRLGVGVDLADAVALAAAGAKGDLPVRAAVMGAGVALTAAGLGVVARGDT